MSKKPLTINTTAIYLKISFSAKHLVKGTELNQLSIIGKRS